MRDEYMEYPGRRRGMDHSRYQYRSRPGQPTFNWPNGAGLAIAVVVHLESFRLDQSRFAIRPMGDPMVEYPDFWGYTRLEYGNRAGVERVARVLEAEGIPVSGAVNSDLSERYPVVLNEVTKRGWEIIGHGTSGSIVLHDGMQAEEEERLVREALTRLRSATGQAVRGWLSPSMSESRNTLDLLASLGVEYVLDWVNDDLPYEMSTRAGPILSVPYAYELNDLHVIGELNQTTWDYVEQVADGAEFLVEESSDGAARSMCLAIHPWIMGVPHRAVYLEALLAKLRRLPRVWWTTPGDIADAYVGATEAQTMTRPA